MRCKLDVPVVDGWTKVYRDLPGEGTPRGRILIVAPYGLHASTLAPLSAALVEHDYETIRFDARNHVGAGSGDIADFRLSQVAEDCVELIERFRPTCVLAISLGARAALRALAHVERSIDAVLVTPVVEVRSTLRAVLDRDWFEVPDPEVPELVRVLDHDIRASSFLRDCERHRLVERAESLADLSTLGGRVTFVAGSHDPWVEHAAVEDVAASVDAERVRMTTVDAEHHALHEDPALALRMIATAIVEIELLHVVVDT